MSAPAHPAPSVAPRQLVDVDHLLATRAAQGLPPHVEDHATLELIGRLLSTAARPEAV
jgi:hypothetical protein